MTNAERLADVLSIFIERYRLREPYDSRGAAAIQAAIKAEKPDIPELRRMLTEEYNLYPHHEARVLAILDQCEMPSEAPASVDEAAPLVDEEEPPIAEAEPVREPVRRGRRTR